MQRGVNGTAPDPHGIGGCLGAMLIGGLGSGTVLLAFVYGGAALFG